MSGPSLSIRVRRAASFALVATAVVLGLSLSPRAAAAADVTTGRGSSCIATVVGWTSGLDIPLNNSTGLWGSGRDVRFKCYYSPSLAPTAVGANGFMAGNVQHFPSHQYTSQFLLFQTNNTNGTHSAASTTPSNASTACNPGIGSGNVTVFCKPIVTKSAEGYVEFTVKRYATYTSSANTVLRRGHTPATGYLSTGGGASGPAYGTYLFGQEGVSGLSTTWAKTGTFMWEQDFDAAEPPYRWGPAAGTPCQTFGIKLNNPDPYARVLTPGETVLASSPTTGIGNPSRPVTEQIHFRFDPLDTWHELFRNPTATAPGGGMAWNVWNTLNRNTAAQNVYFRCIDTGDNGGATFYYDALTGTTRTEPNAARPCAGIVITWPTGTMTSGETYDIRIDLRPGVWGGPIEEIRLSGLPDPEGGPITQQIEVPSTDAQLLDVLQQTQAYPIAAPWSGMVRYTPEVTMNASDLQLNCYDHGGVRNHFAGRLGSGSAPIGKSDRSLSDCSDTGGISVHPASWLKFAINSAGCVAGYLVIPSQEAVNDLKATAMDSDLQFMLEPMTAVGSGFSTLGGVGGTCAGTPVNLPLGGTSSQSVNLLAACDGPAATARNVSFWMSRLTVIIALGWFLQRTALRILGVEDATPSPVDEATK